MKKSVKVSIISLLCVIAVALLSFATVMLVRVNAEEVVWSKLDSEVLEEKISGTSFTVPTRTVTVSGTTEQCDYRLIFPNGNQSTTDESVVLSNVGTYYLQYFKTIGGIDYFDEVSFKVCYATASVTNIDSSAQYGDFMYGGTKTAQGIICSLQDGDSVSINSIIDIPYENEDIELLSFFVNPTIAGNRDFSSLYITFTDVSNPDCYLTFAVNSGSATNNYGITGAYIEAGGSGQKIKGLESGTKLHTDDGFGCYCMNIGFYSEILEKNTPVVSDPSKLQTTLWFNPYTCDIKAGNKSIQKLKVCNTLSNDFYGDESDVKWGGFESGKVKVTFTPVTFNAASANFVITSVRSVDLSRATVEDVDAPEITVNTEYDEQSTPKAWVNYAYAIPSASAYDLLSGICEVKTTVYSNYTTKNPSIVEIIDGKFTPKSAGVYAICYTAVDDLGNCAEKIVWVRAEETPANIDISIPSQKVTSGVLGELIEVAKPNVIGGTGNLYSTLNIYTDITKQQKTAEINTADSIWAFRPTVSGELYVEYTYYDYNGYSQSNGYEISVSVPESPIFRQESVTLPRVLVSGFDYELPQLIAYDYTTGSLQTYLAKVKVVDANGEKTYTSGEKFKPTVSKSGDKISITYFHKYNDGQNEIALDCVYLPTIIPFGTGSNSNTLQFENFFYSEEKNYTTKLSKDGLLFTLDEGDSIKWTFANQLVYKGFAFQVLMGDVPTFSAIHVTLTDSIDLSKTLELYIKNNDGTYTISYLNNEETLDVTKTLNAPIYTVFDLVINQNGNLVFDDATYGVLSKFGGFESGKVTFDFEITGIVEGYEFYVNKVMNHGISSWSKRDTVSPNISVLGEYGGFFKVGTQYKINSVAYADVISPNVKATLSVVDNNGNYIYGFNGVQNVLLKDVNADISYDIVLSSLGKYTVRYTVEEDNYGTRNTSPASIDYAILVVDLVAPQITIKESIPKAVKVNSVIKLPKYVVSDDVSDAKNITVTIGLQDPTGRFNLVTEDSFKCGLVGDYELRYFVLDEAGNSLLKIFNIKVVE